MSHSRGNNSEFGFSSHVVLLFLLVMVAVLFVGCGKESDEVVSSQSSFVPPPSVPYHIVRSFSEVDGRELTARVFFPDGYDNAHQRPLVAVLPDTPFPELPSLGQAIVAKLDSPRPTGCPDPLLLSDYRTMVEFLIHNFAVEPGSVFLAGGRREHIPFAAQQTPLFAGVCFFFDQDVSCDFNEIPLRNLRNIPVYLDNSAPVGQCAGILELEKRLNSGGNSLFAAPVKILDEGGANAVLASAFAWVAKKATPIHETLTWECTTPRNGNAWWMRVDEISNTSKPAVFSAHCQTTAKGWGAVQISMRNIQAFSIQTNSPQFPKNHPITLTIDGMKVGVPSGKGWLSFKRHEGKAWKTEGMKDSLLAEEALPAGMGALLGKKPLFVVGGDATSNRAGLWSKAAQSAARAWQNATGVTPVIKTDAEVSAEDLVKYNLVLFGGAVENHLSETLLEGEPLFLKRLFHGLEEAQRVDDKLALVTLCPAEVLSKDTTAVLILANGDEAIPTAWQPLLDNSALRYDYLFHSDTLQIHGKLNADWTPGY